jgi:hypothetical protein
MSLHFGTLLIGSRKGVVLKIDVEISFKSGEKLSSVNKISSLPFAVYILLMVIYVELN